MRKNTHSPHVVFVTAYDSYAIKAFDENAIDRIFEPKLINYKGGEIEF